MFRGICIPGIQAVLTAAELRAKAALTDQEKAFERRKWIHEDCHVIYSHEVKDIRRHYKSTPTAAVRSALPLQQRQK
jgi:hypothetical protein